MVDGARLENLRQLSGSSEVPSQFLRVTVVTPDKSLRQNLWAGYQTANEHPIRPQCVNVFRNFRAFFDNSSKDEELRASRSIISRQAAQILELDLMIETIRAWLRPKPTNFIQVDNRMRALHL